MRKHRFAAAVALTLLTSIFASDALAQTEPPLDVFERQRLTAPFGGSIWDHLGTAVALEGPWLLVGGDEFYLTAGQSREGEVRIFEYDGTEWVYDWHLTTSSLTNGDRFGSALALSGDLAAVGAPGHDDGITDSGAVFVFHLAQTMPVPRLRASDASAFMDFGSAVAFDGDTIFVGTWLASKLYVFERTGNQWFETGHIVPSIGIDPASQFGVCIAIDGDRMAVGAPGHDGLTYDTGAVFVFQRVGTAWVEQEKITLPTALVGHNFGDSVSISGDTLAIGARGMAYAYSFGGFTWQQDAAFDAGTSSGTTVATDGDSIFVGVENPGHVVHYETFGGGTWLAQPNIVSSDGTGGKFGVALTVHENTLVVGAPERSVFNPESGAAYAFHVGDLFERYCIAAPNSTGFPAFGAAEGTARIHADDLTLLAFPVPPSQNGVFFYGSAQVQLPFGNGFQCVGPGATGVARLAVEQASAGGVLQHALDFASPPTAMTQITPGSTWNFQAWYRDPAAGGAAFNLSDAIAMTFHP